MKKEPRWLRKSSILAIHEILLAEHGGKPGLVDEGRLESALAAPIHSHSYESSDLFQLAATYADALIQDHPFIDGNKRSGLTAAGVFLEMNGFRLDAPEGEAVLKTMALAARKIERSDFADWLRNSSTRLKRPSRKK